jgi:glycine reductase complex component B subunit gamma
MAGEQVRLVYYVNQFFGGIGGEERADEPFQVIDRARGPAIGFAHALLANHGIACASVTTAICGDNYFTAHQEEVVKALTALLRQRQADLFAAGPAFMAGRYGMACARLSAAAEAGGMAAVTAMAPENPGAASHPSALIVSTTDQVTGMGPALARMAALASVSLRGGELPSALDGGYLPRGKRRQVLVGRSAAWRAVEMLEGLLAGATVQSEIPLPRLRRSRLVAAPPVADLSTATIALVCEGGLVPAGNPDRIPTWQATRWAAYAIPGEGLRPGSYEVSHGGIDSRWGTAEPNRLVPYDAAIAAVAAGRVGRVLDTYLVTTGNGGRIHDMTRIGHEMAETLRAKGADGVVLTGT